MESITCPEVGCDAPAEIVDRWVFGSTDGPVEHVKTRCREGHCLTPRLDQLKAASAANRQSGSAA